ncbi:MAG: hypothetical protein L3K15_01860 [Thermoplasmata archaeon]|nr:hypothetical protein [Thermoplasmata archaeon]
MTDLVERSRDLRDRAFLVVLLLVGSAALASGLFSLLVLGSASAPTIFTSVFGASVLLVSWLFLAPEIMPRVFESPRSELVTLSTPIPATRPTGTPVPAASRPRPGAPARPRVAAASAAAVTPAVVGRSPAVAEPLLPSRPRPSTPPAPSSAASEVLKELDDIYEQLQPPDDDRRPPVLLDARPRGLGGPSAS